MVMFVVVNEFVCGVLKCFCGIVCNDLMMSVDK